MATLPLRPRASAALLVRWGIIIGLLVLVIVFMTAMPLKSYSGPLKPLSPAEIEISANARKHVSALATTIGPRNTIQYKELQQASQYIEDAFKRLGFEVKPQEYEVDGRKVRNLVAETPGSSLANEIVVVGAHYDTVFDSPGADDNATGVAALIELARIMRDIRPARSIRWVAFVNEEPPYFQTSNMGSVVYARRLHKAKEDVVAAVSLETIGMYSDEDGSQDYPVGFSLLYPSKGNFIGFVGNIGSRRLVRANSVISRRECSSI